MLKNPWVGWQERIMSDNYVNILTTWSFKIKYCQLVLAKLGYLIVGDYYIINFYVV